MQNRNIDGIKKFNKPSQKKAVFKHQRKIVSLDAISLRPKPSREPQTLYIEMPVPIVKSSVRSSSFRKFYNKQRVPVMAAVAGLLLAFGGGMWAALNITKSAAESEPQVLGAEITQAPEVQYSVPLNSSAGLGPVNSVPNDVLFNMTIGQLENYLAEALKTPEAKQAEILAARKEKLKQYLEEKKSPLAGITNTLAELKHWEMVLAISNSESSLGKRCYNNNCSGIGVEPGHPLWRDYASKSDWAKDLDRLLEKRYKDWTLEKMNGVYNQPGSKNWLLASKQILEDLQERNIE